MDNVSASRVRAQFESLLLAPLLEPMESAFGEYGEIAAQSFGDLLAKEFSA